MTRKQQAALAFIARHIETHGHPPTFDEMTVGFGLKSKSGTSRLVDALEERGYIRRMRYRARSIEIIDPGEIKLNAEIFRLVSDYAKAEGVKVDIAANELLRQVLGASG